MAQKLIKILLCTLMAAFLPAVSQGSAEFGPGSDNFSTDDNGSATDSYNDYQRDSSYSGYSGRDSNPNVDSLSDRGYNTSSSGGNNDRGGWDTHGGDHGDHNSGGNHGDHNNGGSNRSGGDPNRGYLEGFGYVGHADPEYPNHENAMTTARAQADAACASGCSNTDRALAINQSYYSALDQTDTELPTGPMETMAHFNGPKRSGTENPVTVYNESAEGQELMDQIDDGVRNGDYGVLMPGQMEAVYTPEFLNSLNATQALGLENAAVVVDFTNEGSLVDPNKAAGLSIAVGGRGGTIAIDDGNFNGETLRHEATHAGERTLLTIDWEADYGNMTSAERQNLFDAASLSLGANRDRVQEEDCSSCGELSEVDDNLATYYEARAFATEGGNNIGYYADRLEEQGIPAADADRIAADVLGSDVIQEQVDMINQAAQDVLNRNL